MVAVSSSKSLNTVQVALSKGIHSFFEQKTAAAVIGHVAAVNQAAQHIDALIMSLESLELGFGGDDA